MIKLENPEFDSKGFIKKLESTIYLILAVPLIGFTFVLLEKEKAGTLRSTFFDDPDYMFHSVMLIGIAYVLMRTIGTWKRDLLRSLQEVEELDLKMRKVRRPIIYRNILWAFGAAIGTYGLYEKGDMLYALVFAVFLILLTANRPSPHYFIKLFQLTGEEKKWMQK
jgi:hypothetical protein